MPDTDSNRDAQLHDHGGWDEWDEIWQKSVGTSNELVYVEGRPRTLGQLVMQGYLADLLACTGSRGESLRFVELGSGRGTISLYLAQRGHDVTMVDLSRQGLGLAQAHARSLGIRVPDAVHADVRETRLPDESFDCVFNIGLLEHFEDPLPVLRESSRLLRENGIIFSVIVPAAPMLRRWPVQLSMNPIATGYRITRRAGSHVLRRSKQDSDMVRTDFTRRQWLEMSTEIGGLDATCVAYNAYHQVYQTPQLERWITVPVYRWHHGLRKLIGRYPSLRTFGCLSRADLLIARKTGSAAQS